MDRQMQDKQKSGYRSKWELYCDYIQDREIKAIEQAQKAYALEQMRREYDERGKSKLVPG